MQRTRTEQDRRAASRGERGTASILMLSIVVMVAAIVAAVGPAGDELVARSRLEGIADVSALAAATGGRVAAHQVANGSGAELAEFRAHRGDTVVVVVAAHGRRATAAAAPVEVRPDDEPVGGA